MDMEYSDADGWIDFSDVTAIFITFFCFILLVIIIHVMNYGIEADSSQRVVNFGPQQRNMVKVASPFVLELIGKRNVLRGGARLLLSSLCPCHMVVIWGPDIQALHKLMLEPGCLIRRKVLKYLIRDTDINPFHFNTLEFDSEGKHIINVPCPDSVTSLKLGVMPRKRYPLCVFVFTQSDDDDEIASNNNEIIGLFTIIHLKDRVVTQDTHIIAKYVKTYGVPIYSLQNLFSSTNNHCGNSSPTNQQGNPEIENHFQSSNSFSTSNSETALNTNVFTESVATESRHNNLENFDYVEGLDPTTPKVYADCVVCQVKPANCAILPCRHHCICFQCLLQLNKCPICRSAIDSYFVVGSEGTEWSQEDEREHAQIIRQGIAAQVENMFATINNWVGFT